MKLVAMGFRGFPGVEGGIETHAEQLYPRLAEYIDEVHVVTRAEYTDSQVPYRYGKLLMVPLRSGPFRSLETLVHTCKAMHYAIAVRADLLHVHGIGPAVVAPIARLFGIRTLVTHHGKDYDADKWSLLSRLMLHVGERLGMRFADQRITVSKHLSAHVASKFGRETHVIPNGVLLPLTCDDTAVLDELDLQPGRYVIEVARVTEHKRQHELIDAFIGCRLEGWKLVIVGDCPTDDYGSMVARKAECADGVVLAGFRTGNALSALFQHAGLFVLPSSYEGMPIAVLEALSYGLPVLLSDIPAHRELELGADHYHCVGDVAALRSAIQRFCSPGDIVALREQSQALAARYDWDVIAARTLEVIAATSTSCVTQKIKNA